MKAKDPSRSPLIKKVRGALDRLLPPGEAHLGVAVSGGPDSVALLSALAALAKERPLALTVLHVNHRLRPEAEDEQRLVESLAQRWQLLVVVKTLTPPQGRTGIEEWARTERYRFFHAATEAHGLSHVAVAHTADDQAETVLFRALRGSARRGLAGIPPQRGGWLVRPLLQCTRQEVLAYLATQDVPFATDTSNADLRHARNKIRHVLLPFLEKEFAPHARRHLATLAETLRTEEEWLESLATAARARVQTSPHSVSVSQLAVEPLALQSRILRQWVEQQSGTNNFTFHHFSRLMALCSGSVGVSIDLPGGVSVRRERDALLLAKTRERGVLLPPPPSYSYVLHPGQELVIHEGGWRVTLSSPFAWENSPARARLTDPWQALFDVDGLPESLWVRNFRAGDHIRPLGMRGRKKVHDVFIDAKVPRARRQHLPLFVVGAEVVWVPGHVRGAAAVVTPATHRACRALVNPLPEKQLLC